MPDYKTLTDKVRYVIEKDPAIAGDALVVAVWQNFYWPYFEPPDVIGTTPTLLLVSNAARLPGPEKILAAAHRIRHPKPPAETKVPMPITPSFPYKD